MFPRLALMVVVSASALGSSSAAWAESIGPGNLDGVRDLGRAGNSVQVSIAAVLRYRHTAELDRLVQRQATPGTALYHRFLTPAQFRSSFAPTPQEYWRVATALARAGFTVAHTFANRTVVDASAPAPIAAAFFGTEIHRVLTPEGLAYTNVRAGAVPAGIADSVLSVVGLDSVRHMEPMLAHANVMQQIRPDVRTDGHPLYGPDGFYGPRIFIHAYDLPAANGVTGSGRAAGLAEDGDFQDSDLAAYLAYFGVKRTGPATIRIPVDGGAPKGVTRDSFEATLDVEALISLAPGAALYVYEAPKSATNANFIDIDNTVVDDNVVDILSTSYGYCESRLNRKIPGYSDAVDAIVEQGAAQGITFHAATGDSGAVQFFGCPKRVSVSVPADVPHGMAIGGTTLQVDAKTGQETSEVGWNGPGGATGGGVSVIFPVPSYQQGVPNVLAGGRNMPDLAFDADPLTGMSLYYNGSFGSAGGTSLACPIFGATLLEIDQLQGSRAGYFNVTLYDTWQANGYGTPSKPYLRDITVGAIPPYAAGPAYDQMSGIGALQAANFAGLLTDVKSYGATTAHR